MQPVKFNPILHIYHLLDWAEKRDVHQPPLDEVPKHGVVILTDNAPICMGFVRLVEGGYGLIDGYISDPNQPAKQRNEALSLLTDEIIKLSKELGLSALLANTVDKHTLERSLKHGFSALPHATMVKDLRK